MKHYEIKYCFLSGEKVSFGCGQQSCPEGCEEIGSYENNCPICYCKKEIKGINYFEYKNIR